MGAVIRLQARSMTAQIVHCQMRAVTEAVNELKESGFGQACVPSPATPVAGEEGPEGTPVPKGPGEGKQASLSQWIPAPFDVRSNL
jgi:hypothetical protein